MRLDRLKKQLWSTDGSKAVTSSVVFHSVVALAIAISMLNAPEKRKEPEKQSERVLAFNVPGPSIEAENVVDIPQIAPPTSVKDGKGDPSNEPAAAVSIQAGSSGDWVWTPPPPDKVSSTVSSSVEGVANSRIVFPTLSFEGMGTDPVLVDYDIGQFDGAEALQDAARLNRTGRMKMTVQVDERGIPVGCTNIETSGSSILDNLGCGLIMSYRYEPALNNQKKPKAAIIYELLEWSSDKSKNKKDLEKTPRRPDFSKDEDMDGLPDEQLVKTKPKLDEKGNLLIVDDNL